MIAVTGVVWGEDLPESEDDKPARKGRKSKAKKAAAPRPDLDTWIQLTIAALLSLPTSHAHDVIAAWRRRPDLDEATTAFYQYVWDYARVDAGAKKVWHLIDDLYASAQRYETHSHIARGKKRATRPGKNLWRATAGDLNSIRR